MKPENRPNMRTNQNYLSQSNEEHHIGNISLIATVPNFDIVSGFIMSGHITNLSWWVISGVVSARRINVYIFNFLDYLFSSF